MPRVLAVLIAVLLVVPSAAQARHSLPLGWPGLRETRTTDALAPGVTYTNGLGVVNGGPRLLRAGHPDVTATAEGFDHPGDPGFYYAFGLRRNPRTIAGVTHGGRLLLVAVDGRAPGYSAGLDFEEEAAVMRALGAPDAVNLDGGGSTTMTIRGTVVTRPSDATGERPIGDAILLQPR